MRGKFSLLIAIFAVTSLPFASAVPSGLAYLDSTWSLEGEGGELIAMNPNGTILASYHSEHHIFQRNNSRELVVLVLMKTYQQ